MDRTFFKSLYVRDPDGHIVELATSAPGSRRTRRWPPVRRWSGARKGDSERGALGRLERSTSATAERWRSVNVPTGLFSGIPIEVSRRRQRARPHRF